MVSTLMALHVFTSCRRISDDGPRWQAAPPATARTTTRQATNPRMTTSDRAREGSDDQQERVVQGMRPRRDPEAAQQVERAEEDPGDHSEHERIQRQPVPVAADIMECGENSGADQRGEDAGGPRAPPQQGLRSPRQQS